MSYSPVVIQVVMAVINGLLVMMPTHPFVKALNIIAAGVCLGFAVPTYQSVRSCRKMERKFRAKYGRSLRAEAGLFR